MYNNRLVKIAALQLCLLLANVCYAQKSATANNPLQAQIYATIDKVYPASVLMWEIDAASGNRMSAQFSGVVVSKDGTILSAAHVVMTGKTYKVMFADGKECTAKGFGRITIPPNFMVPDAAMLKINESGPWPSAEMGWSSSLKVGQPCISIAYPESVEQRKPNVRLGKVTVLKNQYGFVESSCIMEPGDSGGPLFDMAGRVIGIHSGIQTPEDVNYEVPIDVYRKYWSALNKAENYKAMPADSDLVAKDLLITDNTVAAEADRQKKLLNKVGQQLSSNTVKIKSTVDGKEQIILGALISTEGLQIKKSIPVKQVVISKSSVIGNDPILIGHEAIKLTVIARNHKTDIVILGISQSVGKGIKLTAADEKLAALGTFLISPMVDSLPLIAVLSTNYINLPNKSGAGYIGAATALKDDKLTLNTVLPGGAAAIGGLQTGDVIEEVGGVRVEDELDFVKALRKYVAEDTVVIMGLHAGNSFRKYVVLKYPPQKLSNHPADHFAGGKSIRRDGFDKVLIQDAIVKPQQCGGPVFDSAGNFVGINLARLSRTSAVIMPALGILHHVISALN
ncbi:MAG: trypsin-like peptidase domain-containing protein [Bacteroidota bacterium]